MSKSERQAETTLEGRKSRHALRPRRDRMRASVHRYRLQADKPRSDRTAPCRGEAQRAGRRRRHPSASNSCQAPERRCANDREQRRLLHHAAAQHDPLRCVHQDQGGTGVDTALILLDDAAHLMSPLASGGANLAMYDCAERVRAIVANAGDIKATLVVYEQDIFPWSRRDVGAEPQSVLWRHRNQQCSRRFQAAHRFNGWSG